MKSRNGIKKINVKASCRLAEIKTKIILSSDKFLITSEASDSVYVSSASILIWNLRGILCINAFSVRVELTPQTANAVQEIVTLDTACAISSWRVECVAFWTYVKAIFVVVCPLSDSTCRDGNAETKIKLVLFGSAVEAFSSSSIEVSTCGTHIMAVVVDKDLSGFALFLEDAFSSVHEEVVSDALSAGSVFPVVNFTEFTDFVAEVVIAQVLFWWAGTWLFNLKANSIRLKGVGWNASQACSPFIILMAQITHSRASSKVVWNKSVWTDNFNAFSLGFIVIESPNAFDTFSSELFKSLTKWVNIDALQNCINELSFSANLLNWCAFSIDWSFDWTEAACTGSRISDPFFTLIINGITSPSGPVEESSSSAGQRGSVTGAIVECVSSGTLGTFGEIVVSITS